MDRLEAVERLARLRDTGVLSEAEFIQQKSLVINSSAVAPLPAPAELSTRLQRIDYEPVERRPQREVSPQIHIHNSNFQHAPQPVYYAVPDRKSLVVSYLLWLFLGGLGGHRFYLGFKPNQSLEGVRLF